MVGVVVATHGKLADELIATAQGIVGALAACQGVSIDPHASMEQTRDALAAAVKAVEGGDGVIILTDMFGGTPSNLALTLLDAGTVEVVTGVNLPMLLKLSTCRAEKLAVAQTAVLITGHGQKNITHASELLRARTQTR